MAKQVIAAEDLALTADRDRAVPFLSAEAAFLLARKGRPIAAKYESLVTSKGALKEAEPEANKEATAPENKAAGNKTDETKDDAKKAAVARKKAAGKKKGK